MKSIIKEKAATAAEEIKYPCLMESSQTGSVVLFTSLDRGTVVHTGKLSMYKVGHSDSTWIVSNFIKFQGTIELSND